MRWRERRYHGHKSRNQTVPSRLHWDQVMPRRIVLLSDGTGNSSAKVWRTNVWRMFSALDLTSDEQVACYDDGVGSSSFQPSAILGGVFGIGLRRNVIALYKFACRNFKEQGDQIYGFGF